MPTFVLIRMEAVAGRQRIWKLEIEGSCPFDDYESEILKDPLLSTELGSIYAYLEALGMGFSLPAKKFRDITPKSEMVKEYEIKSRHLRVYLIKLRDGKLVILGGYKNRQKKDLRKFRSIKRRFLNASKN